MATSQAHNDILFGENGVMAYIQREKWYREEKAKEDAIRHQENKLALEKINANTGRTNLWVAIGALLFGMFMALVGLLAHNGKIALNFTTPHITVDSPMPSVLAKELEHPAQSAASKVTY